MVRLEEILIAMPYEDIPASDRSQMVWEEKPLTRLWRGQERSSLRLPSSWRVVPRPVDIHKAPVLISYCQKAPAGLP